VAACGMCSKTNLRLFKRYYSGYKIYVCAKCAAINSKSLDIEEKANDTIN